MNQTGRIEYHPILGANPASESVSFRFDDRPLTGRKGETVAAALLANGIRTLRRHEETGAPRGIYCNIGHCMECRVTINGITGLRACLTLVEEGMAVASGHPLPTPFRQQGGESG
ncbi:(2Fe-2S)-binding protein [Brevibacillus humidisoli]|uniref:(2Fe-2S)-binding protein n=1 Tax=Brevibacillus humidisoli TaxID=2895522 RepID=UPI001E2E5D7B|nr:(2Fe-2S)-binding protein [Brevibacillus humidisoli]UFJ39563.1 (2Fe-2S)-binding protein [Brevibacillus humidisoli]